MRWDMVSQAWALARGKYPNVKRLYVDVPGRLAAVGTCRILDLDAPGKPLGELNYDFRSVDGQPRMVIAIDGQTASIGMPKTAVRAKVETSVKSASAAISPELICARYPDKAELAAQLARLAVGHKDGIKEAASGVSRSDVSAWLKAKGFERPLLDGVCAAIKGLGVKLTAGFNRSAGFGEFKELQRVRVKDERHMDHQKCGQILNKKRAKDGYWYELLVDGTESPEWFPEDKLDSIHVGWIAKDKDAV